MGRRCAILAFIGLYLLIVYRLSKISVYLQPDAPDEIAIYIITNGVHTDIVMPVKRVFVDWGEFIKHQHKRAANDAHNFITMGWGDKGFYLQTPTWADIRLTVTFKAATGLSTTAVYG